MPTLHVRNVPKRLYDRLQGLAGAEDRSLSAQVITLLDHAVADHEMRARQGKLLAGIRRHRFTPPRNAPTSEELLRQDRER